MDLGLFLCAAPCLVGELPGGDVKPVISVTGHALLSAEALCGANRKGEGEGIPFSETTLPLEGSVP